MKTKLLFLLLFVPAHAFASLAVLQHGFNPPPGGHSALFRMASAVMASPILVPLVMFDPDGERLPKWIQLVSVPLNSLVWGIAILLVAGLIKRVVRESREHATA